MRVGWLMICALGCAVGCADPSEVAHAEGTSGEVAPQTSSSDGGDTSSSTGFDIPVDGTASTGGGSDSGPPSGTTTGKASGSSTGEAPRTFEVGFDVAEISPNAGHLALGVYMGAYGAPFVRGPAASVHDDIFIRSVSVGLDGEGFVAAVADLPGMGNTFTRAIRTRVAENTGLPPEHVLIGTTHTHSAPDFQGLWGGGPSEYRDPVIDEIVGSMSRAWLLREPATLEVATTTAPNTNRRAWDFTDDELTVLLAHDLGGDLLGSVGVFAAHPTILGDDNDAISRDWCGGYVDTMESLTEAPSVLFGGILGDASASPPPGPFVDDFERAFAYGSLIADAAHQSLSQAEPIESALVVEHTSWTLPVQNALFQVAAALDLLDYAFSEGGKGQAVDTQATYVRLGTQLQVVTFPGEALTRTGLEIKDAMSTPHRAVLGQTGDALGYFILSDEWMTGRNDDYEETVSLHETAGDTAIERIRALVESDDY